jgi:hypothetical protein
MMIKRNALIAALGLAGFALAPSANAIVVNLANSNEGTINGAIFQFTQPQPTGTGVINPFLRLHGTGNQGFEQGYNTSGRPVPMDQITDPNFTRNITFSDLQSTTVALNGTEYFRILLDVNEPGGNKSLITLDSLQLYTSAQGSQTTSNVATLGTLRYNLDLGGNNSVIIDASRNNGSGSGDVYIYIPTANFAGTAPTDFVYLYAAFGSADGDATGGFEEFALVRNITPIPELNALFPIIGLMVAVGSTHILRRRRMAKMSV